MKKTYVVPQLSVVVLSHDDVLTASGDNDAPFIGGGSNTLIDNGWSNYY